MASEEDIRFIHKLGDLLFAEAQVTLAGLTVGKPVLEYQKHDDPYPITGSVVRVDGYGSSGASGIPYSVREEMIKKRIEVQAEVFCEIRVVWGDSNRLRFGLGVCDERILRFVTRDDATYVDFPQNPEFFAPILGVVREEILSGDGIKGKPKPTKTGCLVVFAILGAGATAAPLVGRLTGMI